VPDKARRGEVSVLTWTGSGAVERPRVVQIRLQRTYPGRVRAGAPVPTRSMPTAEVVANLRYFADAGTRGRACDALVLSGVGVIGRPDLAELCAEARRVGIQRITVHAGVEDLDGLEPRALPVDQVVVPLQVGDAGATLAAGARALLACAEAGVPAVANTVLVPPALPLLPAAARAAIAARVAGYTLTFPFPVDGSGEVAPAPRAVAALLRVVPSLRAAGVPVALKGLPVCYLGELAGLARRSANRWYVDADHQLAKALLFFPDVVAFHKSEVCRFCAAADRCDGFFATYLRRPGFPPLSPLPEPAGP